MKVEPDLTHPNGDALCAKGRAAAEIADHPSRLTAPLRRVSPKGQIPPRWEEMSWPDAVRLVGERLRQITTESGANSVVLQHTSPSGTPLSDSIEWVDRLFRLIGSANILTSTENCNWHKDFTHTFTFGTKTPPADWLNSRVGILWGHNPAKTWLAQASLIAKARVRGMKLIVIDPRKSTSALESDLWLRVAPGTDAALALFAIRELIDRQRYDVEFVRCWTNAAFLIDSRTGHFLQASDITSIAENDSDSSSYIVWDAKHQRMQAVNTASPTPDAADWSLDYHNGSIRSAWSYLRESVAPWDSDATSVVTGIPPADLRMFVDMLCEGMPAVAYHAWTGIAQHGNATQSERAIACLYALLGGFDRAGGNVSLPAIPIRSPALSTPAENKATGLGAASNPLGPAQLGYITGAQFQRASLEGDPYRVRALLAFGGNPVLTQPEPERMAQSLARLDFYVHVDIFHNPSNDYADVLLPATSMYEHDSVRPGWELTHDGIERLQYRPQLVSRRGDTRSDSEIAFLLAKELGFDGDDFFSLDLDEARDRVLEPLNVSLADLKRQRVAHIPLSRQFEKYRSRNFATPSRRVELYSEVLYRGGYAPVPSYDPPPGADPRFPYLLSCVKNGYYCHSQHRGIGSLRKRSPYPAAYISPTIATAHELNEGQYVEIRTESGAVTMMAFIDESLNDGLVVAEFGWWEENSDLGVPASDPLSSAGNNYNLLISGEHPDPVAGSVAFRSTRCAISPAPRRSWAGLRDFVVDTIHRHTADIRSVCLRPVDAQPLPAFLPGQHLELNMPGTSETTRRYSLTSNASTPGESYEIAVRLVPDGEVSPFVHQLITGDVVRCRSPRGSFTIPARLTPTPIVFVALGVGITPFMSALRTAVSVSRKSRPAITLLYGARCLADLAYLDEIVEIGEHLGSSFQMTVFLSRERQITSENSAYGVVLRRFTPRDVSDELLKAGARVYYCGPPEGARAIRANLQERGVGAYRVFAESFFTEPSNSQRPTAEATVTFARTGRTTRWSPSDGLTLLELAERADVQAPSGCRLGQCESCATRLISGTVVHLTDVAEDFQAGNECLTCQALPCGDVVIDL